MIRFSIIIPCYNYADYLPRALESAAAQPGEDYEIIVVDDGSTDGTSSVVAEFRRRFDDRLMYLYQDNRGSAAARNRGVRASSGEYILFLDADDALMPNVLERIAFTRQASGPLDYFLGDHVLVQTKGKSTRRSVKRLSADGRENLRRYFRENFTTISNGSVAIHRRVFGRIIFPESVRLWEDRVFHSHLFATCQGKLLGYPLVTIYRHDDSLSHDLQLVRRDGPRTVRLLFDAALLPANLMALENEYTARIQLFIFQMCYSRGRYEEARQAFHQALRSSPLQVIRPKVWRRYFKMALSPRGSHRGTTADSAAPPKR